MRFGLAVMGIAAVGGVSMGLTRRADSAADAETVAALDTKYQAAVKANDAAGMAAILDEKFILVTGKGAVFNREDLLKSARNQEVIWEHQEDTRQTVRVWGNTAVVTALLWEKGMSGGKPIDKKLWFSDTYVKTAAGWKYVFGQASMALPE